MLREKENKGFVIISIALFMILFLMLLSGKVFSRQIAELGKENNSSNSFTVNVAWQDLYPYDTVVKTEKLSDSMIKDDRTMMNRVTNILSKFGNLGNTWAKMIYKYSEISKIGYVIGSKLTDPSVGNSYIKLKNGYWVKASASKMDFVKAQESVINYYFLQKYLEDKGIEFLYCYAPTKECAWNNELPSGVQSYANENIDTYINALESYGVNCIDIRESIHEEGLDHYSLFYKTDHHWNIDAGIWAASIIESEINNRFDISINDVYHWGTYSRTTFPQAMFGSYGKGVTHFNEQSEDFDILFPDFETKFKLEIPDKNIDEIGSFQEIFIDYDGLNSVIEEGGGYAYEQILYGNRPYKKIVNMNNPDGPKVLMIRDSFSIVVAPYLALSCSELILLDTRAETGNFNGSIVNCINDFEPDIVLALQNSPQSIVLNK